MEERIAIEPDFLESPIESEETVETNQVDMVKPVKVRLIDYPPGFKSQFVKGKSFQVNGEVFEVYDVKEPKNGRPRFLVRGIGIVGILEEDNKQECKHLRRGYDGENDYCLDCGFFPLPSPLTTDPKPKLVTVEELEEAREDGITDYMMGKGKP